MNRNEVEQWMKESLGNKDYVPREDEWVKLREAITPPSRRNGLFVFAALSTGWKLAASVVLLVAAGSMIYLIEGNKDKAPNNVAITVQESRPVAPVVTVVEKVDPASGPAVSLPHRQHSSAFNTPIHTSSVPVHANVTASSPVPNHEPQIVNTDPAPSQAKPTIATAPKPEAFPTKPVTSHPDIARDLIQDKQQSGNGFTVGIAAQAGRASVGNMRYQLGVVARKDLSTKFYTSATLAMASTNVSYVQQNTFQTVIVNTSSINSGSHATVQETSAEARYGKDILSIGLSPNLGYRVTPRLAISAGVTVYRNLDQSLNLKNEESLDPVTLSNNVVSTSQHINSWDAGLTGSASYNVTRKLGVDIQYRYGLSPYMYQGSQSIRNSGVGIGLNYMFGRP